MQWERNISLWFAGDTGAIHALSAPRIVPDKCEDGEINYLFNE